MAAVDEANSTLVSKCMDFCQALASQGQAFNFSLAIGPDFSFSLDTTRSKVTKESKTKKKASPSTLRRNAKRREEFVKKIQNSSVRTTTEDDTATSDTLTCDQCDAAFKTRNGLKIHKGKSHKETTKPPEKMREASSPGPALSVSPSRESSRIVPCHNCGEEMTSTHLCDSVEAGDVGRACTCDCEFPICCNCQHEQECSCSDDDPNSGWCSCEGYAVHH